MAAKRTVFLNSERELIRTVPQTEVKKLKAAFRIVMRDYFRMREQENKFGKSLEMFCLNISPWTIPHKVRQKWLKEFHLTATVKRG